MTDCIGLSTDLFGRKCFILTGYNRQRFVYRILRSGVKSNGWCEVPITYQSEQNPVLHEESESVLFVVLDTLIDDHSRIIKVAEKDVELI